MKILSNPWTGLPGYNCFGCCDKNPLGLKMKFTEQEDHVRSEWIANPDFQGYNNVLHGGIQASLIDEIAGWTIFVKANTGGVTSRLEIQYRKPVVLDEKPVILKEKENYGNKEERIIGFKDLNTWGYFQKLE